MKRRWRYNEQTKKMEEIDGSSNRFTSGIVIPDIEPFVSPVDGTIISTRPVREAHMRQHGLAPTEDYNKPGGYWDKAVRARADYLAGKTNPDSKRRKAQMSDAFEHLRNQQRAKNGR